MISCGLGFSESAAAGGSRFDLIWSDLKSPGFLLQSSSVPIWYLPVTLCSFCWVFLSRQGVENRAEKNWRMKEWELRSDEDSSCTRITAIILLIEPRGKDRVFEPRPETSLTSAAWKWRESGNRGLCVRVRVPVHGGFLTNVINAVDKWHEIPE